MAIDCINLRCSTGHVQIDVAATTRFQLRRPEWPPGWNGSANPHGEMFSPAAQVTFPTSALHACGIRGRRTSGLILSRRAGVDRCRGGRHPCGTCTNNSSASYRPPRAGAVLRAAKRVFPWHASRLHSTSCSARARPRGNRRRRSVAQVSRLAWLFSRGVRAKCCQTALSVL